MAAAARAAERPRRLGSDANDLDTAGLLEHPLSADAAASPPDRLLGSEPSEDNEEEEPRAGRADAGQAPTRAAGPDAGPDADASPMGERGLEASSLLDVLLGGAEEEEEEEEGRRRRRRRTRRRRTRRSRACASGFAKAAPLPSGSGSSIPSPAGGLRVVGLSFIGLLGLDHALSHVGMSALGRGLLLLLRACTPPSRALPQPATTPALATLRRPFPPF